MNFEQVNPFTFELKCIRKGASNVSLSHAANLLCTHIPPIMNQCHTPNREGYVSEDIITFICECVVDVEVGAPVSVLFLSNLIHNTQLYPSTPRTLYSSVEGDLCVVGYGAARYISSMQGMVELYAKGRMSSEVLAIGGEPFQQDSESLQGWIIPQIELRSVATETGARRLTLSCHLCVQSNATSTTQALSTALQLLTRLDYSLRPDASTSMGLPPLVGGMGGHSLNESEYCKVVDAALEEFERGGLTKVVVALARQGTAVAPINAAALLLAVVRSSPSDEGRRYTFLFAPKGPSGSAFVSLSPERLCSIQHHCIITEAIAGTFPRELFDKTPGIIDDKTRREHGVVSEYICSKLGGLGDVRIDSVTTHSLRDVVHLKQVLSVHPTSSSMTDPALIAWATNVLHPTPAVCGLPVEPARLFLTSHEKFNRGLYASYCGVLTPLGGELFVGLRSALVSGCNVQVYAGAGLVPGSVPKAEWAEINLKMSQFVQVLESTRRPALQREFGNATAAMAAVAVEEMLRQGLAAFVVCPGSRSTPFAVAIYRNSAARAVTQVVHDERSAGFYALGCARSGILCGVLVTSGTAVSNLLPSISEAREAGLAIVIITADRPSESRDVGEAQTMRQVGLFTSLVGFERDYAALSSNDVTTSATLMSSILSDMSFAVGEVARRRGRSVHLNFQIRKSEINPDEIPSIPADFNQNISPKSTFSTDFQRQLSPKVLRWLSCDAPYTAHYSLDTFITSCHTFHHIFNEWCLKEWSIWSVLLVIGELRTIEEILEVKHMVGVLQLPCICDLTSGLLSSTNDSNLFFGVDTLLYSDVFAKSLACSTRLVLRIGGPIISARVQDWVSRLPLATTMRIRDDGYSECRHDPQWVADIYVHASVAHFCKHVSNTYSASESLPGVCAALELLLLASTCAQQAHITEEDAQFSEPVIARTILTTLPSNTPLFLSSSMACRDMDSSACIPLQGFGRVGCNRGVNGIDGVISSATGYAVGTSSSTTSLVLVIGDIAALHDISGIAIAAASSPGHVPHVSLLGGGKIGKIICVNNSGGAIFSFLPAAQHRNDFFTPYLDTPHTLNLANIASGLTNANPQLKCVRVSNMPDLKAALLDSDVLFIECCHLPSHERNVQIHKDMGKRVSSAFEAALIARTTRCMRWSLCLASSSDSLHRPLVILLHGWLGSEDDWTPLLSHLHKSKATNESGMMFSYLTVSSNIAVHPSVFCHALQNILQNIQKTISIVFIGYSQGARLAMHYKSLFPSQVAGIISLSSAPGKPPSTSLEQRMLCLARETTYNMQTYLLKWYSLPVFSDMTTRCSDLTRELIDRRISEGTSLEHALTNMLCTLNTVDTAVNVVIVGELDLKYLSLAQQAHTSGLVERVVVVPACGHALLVEADVSIVAPPILSTLEALCTTLPFPVRAPKECTITVTRISTQVLNIPLSPPLSILSNKSTVAFPSRNVLRVYVTISADSGESYNGIGELYEPLFDVGADFNELCEGVIELGKIITRTSVCIQCTREGVARGVTEILTFSNGHSANGDSGNSGNLHSLVVFAMQQALLHAFSRAMNVSLIECIGALTGQYTSKNIVRMSSLTSARSNGFGTSTSTSGNGVVKLKVGDENAENDARKVNALVAARENPARKTDWLRLDVNQSWTVEQAIAFVNCLTDEAVSAIAYIEEPLVCMDSIDSNASAYTHLLGSSEKWRRIKVALDETLLHGVHAVNRIRDAIHQTGGATSILVVKPYLTSLTSPFYSTPSTEVTISCTFESGIGLAFLVCIAALYGSSVHGILLREDMKLNDDASTLFAQLIDSTAEHNNIILVSDAMELLNTIADKYSVKVSQMSGNISANEHK